MKNFGVCKVTKELKRFFYAYKAYNINDFENQLIFDLLFAICSFSF